MASLRYAQSSWSTVGQSDHSMYSWMGMILISIVRLDLLASKHVYVFFLKLNNSEEGQPTTTNRTVP